MPLPPGRVQSTNQSTIEIDLSVEVAAGQRVVITCDPLLPGGYVSTTQEQKPELPSSIAKPFQSSRQPVAQKLSFQQRLTQFKKTIRALPYKEVVFFLLALAIYASTRVIRLADFPIYYFCDEAVNTVLALDFVRDNFHNYDGTWFPTYFKDGDGPYCLSTTVYFQILPALVFGKSVWMTRLLEVLIGSLAAIWLALILRNVFKIWFWWAASLFFSVIPVWFIHSRISFGYSWMVAFYAGFLYYYLRYRTDKPTFLFPALLCAALSFYTYSAGPPILAVTGILLLVVDFRYHIQQKQIMWKAILLLLALAFPLARFLIQQPEEIARWFGMYSSYIVQDTPVFQKALDFLLRYLSGFNPLYWFIPHELDLPIYTMKGHSNFPLWMLPLVLYGLYLCIKRIRQPGYSAVLVSLLAAPSAGALVEIASRRLLVIVIPFLLLSFFALDDLLQRLDAWKPIPRISKAYGMTILLGSLSVFLMNDALINGPTWYHDYGLTGMQYGARQVFPAAREYLAEHPDLTLYISPNWTFQAEVVRQFFAPDEEAIRMGTPERFMTEKLPEIEHTAFVLTPSDYQMVLASGKFQDVQIDKVLPYPDGQPGFYFVRLVYVDDIEQILAREQEERARLVETSLLIGGEPAIVRHSRLDMGPIDQVFDGNLDSVVRTLEANPLIVEVEFQAPHQAQSVLVSVGAEKVQISLTLTDNAQRRHSYLREAGATEGNKQILISFDAPILIKSFRLELLDSDAPVRSNVHLWGIQLLP